MASETARSDSASSEDEFVDALNSPTELSLEGHSASSEWKTQDQNGKQNCSNIESDFLLPQLVGHARTEERRTVLPYPRDRSTYGLWSFLKHVLGRDLSRVTMPVYFNEPLSFTQRIVEDIEYVDLLHKAAETGNRHLRLAYLAASSCSMWSTTLQRHSKPFNPLLGETFEYIRPDLGYYCVTEQVSHHPPITALHCQAEQWHYWQEYKLDIRFRGQWATVVPTGLVHFSPSSDGYHYYWNKPNTTIHNIIFGELWADHEGDIIIKCHETGDYAKVTFSPYSSVGRKYKELHGGVFDAEGRQTMVLRGEWHKHFEYRCLEQGEKDWVRIWTCKPQIDNWLRQFGFTLFSMTLNEPDHHVKCPTDSRWRPDQRLLEDGNVDGAAEEKHHLEEKQRAARRAREEADETWQPRWFDYKLDPQLGIKCFRYNGKYWKAVLSDDYSSCPDIY